MTKNEFLFHLKGASYVALKFAERYVKNDLKTNFKYNVTLNASYDSPDLIQFDIYREDDGRIELGLKDSEVVDLIFREGKIPVWIDINVLKSNRRETYLNLLCAGRYSYDKNEFYYNNNGSGPFGIKSPILPPGYKEGDKFKI